MAEHTTDSVILYEVGPRDGLQSMGKVLPLAQKLTWINALAAAGLRHIEVTAFVNPKKVPAMADATLLCQALLQDPKAPTSACQLSALVPNSQGLDAALACGVKHIAVFTATSDAFTQPNIGMTVAQSLQSFSPVVQSAKARGLSVRGYVSTIVQCPYTGLVPVQKAAEVALTLLAMGCDQVSLGETLGVASPKEIIAVLNACKTLGIGMDKLALHPHDTYGMGVAMVQAGLDTGIRCFDSSAGGLGGCPFAPGAKGNVATEAVLYLMNRLGLQTGVDLDALRQANLLL